jgi:hypothetical protein
VSAGCDRDAAGRQSAGRGGASATPTLKAGFFSHDQPPWRRTEPPMDPIMTGYG